MTASTARPFRPHATRRHWLAGSASALLAALAFGGPSIAQSADMPGITKDTIRLGSTMPYSGPASSLGSMGQGQTAAFKMINDRGGINGRKIEFISLDDGYAPPKTVEQTRKLVEQDEVAAIVGALGTSTNAATQKYLNGKKVPQLFIATGADRWSNTKEFPWTMSYQPSYRLEARIYGRYLRTNQPGARIGVLYQNDDLGRDYLNGLRDEFGDDSAKGIVEASYEITDPTVDSQIIALKGAGVQAVLLAGLPKANAQALRKIHEMGWQVQLYISSVGSLVHSVMKPTGPERSVGAISANFQKDVTDPAWKNDAALNEYLTFMKTYLPNGDPTDAVYLVAYGQAMSMAQVLRQCGDDLSRENILRQAANLKDLVLPTLLPGITVNTSPTNFRAITQMQMTRWNGTSWERFGDVVTIRN